MPDNPTFPPFGTAYLPLLISEVSRGNLAPLKAAAQGYWSEIIEESHWAWGLMLALLVIFLSLAMPVLTTRINNEYLGRYTILYSLGPSRDFGPAIFMAWLAPLAGLLIVTLALITLWSWLARRWPLTFRILMTLVVLASLMSVLLAYAGAYSQCCCNTATNKKSA